MKGAVVLILFVASAYAQDGAAVAAAEAACGPREVNFDVKQDTTKRPIPEADSAKALLYVVEDLGQCPDCGRGMGLGQIATDVSGALTKVGMDGSWVGANQGSSYFFLSVEPGEHHLCMNWQSRMAERSRAYAMANLTAEAGKTYYFRARVFPGEHDYSFDLDLVNSDQGKFLVASSSFSVWRARK